MASTMSENSVMTTGATSSTSSSSQQRQGATILVTGGCGYIGSHTIVCLLQQGYNVVVVDNLVNSSPISLDRVAEIAQISNEERSKRLIFHDVDLCDRDALQTVFETSPRFEACIHFAGLKVRCVCVCVCVRVEWRWLLRQYRITL
jgi:NAD(P)-dependent dehydrogenase (short-subunit alcohol dehydrogenase family)